MKAERRKSSGQVLAEFGPALCLLILGFFIPMMDLVGDAVAYGCCSLLNGLQSHEAALVPFAEAEDPAGAVRKGIPEQWKTSGLGTLALANEPITEVSYRLGEKDNKGNQDHLVKVVTTVTCRPLLPVPWPGAQIPGLSVPMTFVIASERAMENPDHAKP